MVSFDTHWFRHSMVRGEVFLYFFVSAIKTFGKGATCALVKSFVSNLFSSSGCVRWRQFCVYLRCWR